MDLGKARAGAAFNHSFRVVNTTGKPAHVENVQTSAWWVKGAVVSTDLAPGEETILQVNGTPTGFRGARTVRVCVHFDKPAPADLVYEVRAYGPEPSAAPAAAKTEPPPLVGGKAEEADRMREVEKKLDSLRKELDALRKDLKQEPPPAGRSQGEKSDTTVVNVLSFKVPCSLRPELAPRIDKLALLMSSDGGRTYEVHASGPPTTAQFRVDVPKDGLYYFKLKWHSKEGNDPEGSGETAPMKILVDSRSGR